MMMDWSPSQLAILALGLLVLCPLLTTAFQVLVLRKPRPKYPRTSSALPLLGNTLDFFRCSKEIHDWVARTCQEMQGKPYLVTCISRPDLLVVSTPELFEDVYKTQFECFGKGPYTYDLMGEFMGDGIFAVDGHKWMRQRKTASNLFTMRTLRESMTETICSHARVLTNVLQRFEVKKESVDLFKLFNRFTIEAFAEIGFGLHLGCLDSDKEHPFQTAFDSAQRTIAQRFIRPQWVWRLSRLLSIGGEGRLKHDMKAINDTVYDIISQSLERRAKCERTDRNDIVSLFLDNASYDSNAKASDFDPTFLRDIVISFLIAGRDTTAQALSWFFVSLNKSPDVERKIREEIVAKLPHIMANLGTFPTMNEVQEMTYLEAAIKETLRLYPSVPINQKEAAYDTVLCDGSVVPAGMTVLLPSYTLGRMEHVWGPDAKEFKPERWIDSATGKLITVSAFKFNSFHAGPRMCLGMNLAMLEMKILISGLLSMFHLEIPEADKATYDFSLTLPVHGALTAHVHRASPMN